MKFCTYDDSTDVSHCSMRDQWVSHWRTSCNHQHQQLIYHVSMLHVFFKTRVCQTIYHSTFWKRTISPWSIRLGSDSSISPWLPSLPTAPWLASSGACGSYQWSLVSKPVSSASPIGIATDNNHASSRSNNALPPSLETDCRLPASTSVSAILFTMARDYVITSQNGCPAFARAGTGAGFSNGNQDPLSA